jgi:hypothetical protein
VIVALADPSDGICGLEVMSVRLETPGVWPPPGVPPDPPTSESSLPLHAHRNAAATANNTSLALCISLNPLP